jgi:general secretion pathway protein J
MTRAWRCRSQDGFTLLELLIAITLLGLLTTMLLAGFRLGTRHVERQTTRIERSAQIPAVQGFLRSRLADAQPFFDQTSGNRRVVFDGRPDGLDFIGAAPESSAMGGLQLFTVEFDPRTTRQLRVRWQLFGVPEVGFQQGSHETVLLDRVAGVAFYYYGTIPPAKGPAWHQAWQDMEYLPSLIRLDLAFSDGGHMPALTVAIRPSSVSRAQ